MKTIKITTGKATIVVVDMPDDVTLEEVNSIQGMINFQTRCLGLYSQVADLQWDLIVETVPQYYWRDYEFLNRRFDHMCSCPTESGLSLLRANGVVLENPVTVDLTGNNELNCDYAEWQSFESQVWKNPYIFIKVK